LLILLDPKQIQNIVHGTQNPKFFHLFFFNPEHDY